MTQHPDLNDVAAALMLSVGLLRRRVRQAQTDDGLTWPETSALARLDSGGPTTSAALARLEQISPQSMGATLAALEGRGLVERRPDQQDGRQFVLSLTNLGLQALRSRRYARTEQLAKALSTGFTSSELKQLMEIAPLIERLAQSL
jgi:DNA-binding MarR family transcriptional regulator